MVKNKPTTKIVKLSLDERNSLALKRIEAVQTGLEQNLGFDLEEMELMAFSDIESRDNFYCINITSLPNWQLRYSNGSSRSGQNGKFIRGVFGIYFNNDLVDTVNSKYSHEFKDKVPKALQEKLELYGITELV